jgi:Xaa-Pro dipeptidase
MICEKMKNTNASQLLVCNNIDIFYLTNKWFEDNERPTILYIDSINNYKLLFVHRLNSHERNTCKEKDLNFEVVIYNKNDELIQLLSNHIKDGVVLLDKHLEAQFLLPLIKLTHNNYLISNVLEQTRLIKDKNEIELMRKSSKLNDEAMELLIENIKTRIKKRDALTEIHLKYKLDEIKKDMDLEYSFDPIIAFGANASDPHHIPNKTELKPGDAIVIDIGFKKDHYCSDMTRTIFYKKNKSDIKFYNIVLEAQLEAINKIKPGVEFSKIDLAARNYIDKNEYGKYFIHTTGHSIGLECHEYGTVTQTNHDSLKPNMIISIEPGIYIPNKIGIRIEDLVLVTKNSYEVLNSYPKQLINIE